MARDIITRLNNDHAIVRQRIIDFNNLLYRNKLTLRKNLFQHGSKLTSRRIYFNSTVN